VQLPLGTPLRIDTALELDSEMEALAEPQQNLGSQIANQLDWTLASLYDATVIEQAWEALRNEATLTGQRIDFDKKQLIAGIVLERWKSKLQKKSKASLGTKSF
jgi:hypothetical protein